MSSQKHQCVILLVIAVFTETLCYYYDPNDKRQMPEKCWNTENYCNHWGAEASGSGYYSRFCWVRCQCKGFATGHCQRDRKCLETSQETPWKCTCSKRQAFFLRADCNQQHLSWRY